MLEYRNATVFEYETNIIGTATAYITTPPNIARELLYGILSLTTDATVANRYIQGRIVDPNLDVVAILGVSAAITATSTSENYIQPVQAVNQESLISEIMNPLVIPEGFAIKIYVGSGVAGDTLTIKLVFMDYQLTSKDDKSASRRRT